MEYRSNRLIFREFADTDLSLLTSLFTNKQVMKYTVIDQFSSEDELKAYFNDILQNNNANSKRNAYEYAIFNASNNRFIGMGDIEISKQNENGGCGEIGYLLLPDYWGKGYATEIAGELIKIGFCDIGLHRICASCNSNNSKSERIMKKIGMFKEGEFKLARYKDGTWQDELRYAILAEFWEE